MFTVILIICSNLLGIALIMIMIGEYDLLKSNRKSHKDNKDPTLEERFQAELERLRRKY